MTVVAGPIGALISYQEAVTWSQPDCQLLRKDPTPPETTFLRPRASQLRSAGFRRLHQFHRNLHRLFRHRNRHAPLVRCLCLRYQDDGCGHCGFRLQWLEFGSRVNLDPWVHSAWHPIDSRQLYFRGPEYRSRWPKLFKHRRMAILQHHRRSLGSLLQWLQ